MRIAFVIPSLRFGVSGVADYTARLALACSHLGHESILVSLPEQTVLTVPDSQIHSWAPFLDHFAPDLVSWQFDPQLFTNRASRIFWHTSEPRFITAAKPVLHVMIHETWDGLYKRALLRRRFKGLAQRAGILRWLRRIRPDRIHTSNELYCWQLRQGGFHASVLPLFGTIEINRQVKPQTDYDADEWSFVIFGPLFGDWDPRPLAAVIRDLKKTLIVNYVGRQSASPVWRLLKQLAPKARFLDHGSSPEDEVSRVLLESHFAVSTYPRVLINKSSTYASYRDHGLSTIVTRYDVNYPGFQDTKRADDILELSDLPSRLFETKRRPIVDSVPLVAAQFLSDISAKDGTRLYSKSNRAESGEPKCVEH